MSSWVDERIVISIMRNKVVPMKITVNNQPSIYEVDILQATSRFLEIATRNDNENAARKVCEFNSSVLRTNRNSRPLVNTSENDELCLQVLRNCIGSEIFGHSRQNQGRCLYSSFLDDTKCRDAKKLQRFKEKNVQILSDEIDTLFPTLSNTDSISCVQQILYEGQGEKFLEIELRCILTVTKKNIIVANWNALGTSGEISFTIYTSLVVIRTNDIDTVRKALKSGNAFLVALVDDHYLGFEFRKN